MISFVSFFSFFFFPLYYQHTYKMRKKFPFSPLPLILSFLPSFPSPSVSFFIPRMEFQANLFISVSLSMRFYWVCFLQAGLKEKLSILIFTSHSLFPPLLPLLRSVSFFISLMEIIPQVNLFISVSLSMRFYWVCFLQAGLMDRQRKTFYSRLHLSFFLSSSPSPSPFCIFLHFSYGYHSTS